MKTPVCINIGCGKPVTFSSTDQNGYKRWRIHCSHCQAASWGKHEHRYGVVPYKTGRCSNSDANLGFPCVVNWDQAAQAGLKISTEVDHKNGNSTDNDPCNLQELCSICHREKGKRARDYDGWKNYR